MTGKVIYPLSEQQIALNASNNLKGKENYENYFQKWINKNQTKSIDYSCDKTNFNELFIIWHKQLCSFLDSQSYKFMALLPLYLNKGYQATKQYIEKIIK